jgi:hypothetical protein
MLKNTKIFLILNIIAFNIVQYANKLNFYYNENKMQLYRLQEH